MLYNSSTPAQKIRGFHCIKSASNYGGVVYFGINPTTDGIEEFSTTLIAESFHTFNLEMQKAFLAHAKKTLLDNNYCKRRNAQTLLHAAAVSELISADATYRLLQDKAQNFPQDDPIPNAIRLVDLLPLTPSDCPSLFYGLLCFQKCISLPKQRRITFNYLSLKYLTNPQPLIIEGQLIENAPFQSSLIAYVLFSVVANDLDACVGIDAILQARQFKSFADDEKKALTVPFTQIFVKLPAFFRIRAFRLAAFQKNLDFISMILASYKKLLGKKVSPSRDETRVVTYLRNRELGIKCSYKEHLKNEIRELKQLCAELFPHPTPREQELQERYPSFFNNNYTIH